MPSIISSPIAADWTQLPFLIRLADDPSPAVRAKIASRLAEYGEGVWRHLEEAGIKLTPSQRHALREALANCSAKPVIENWLDWLQLANENERLEAANAFLARIAWGADADEQLRNELDDWARQYLMQGGAADPEELALFLFGDGRLTGVAPDHFHDPLNGELLHVLRDGRGLPIALCTIFILIGWRLDITVCGVNFPGHFLARAPIDPHSASVEDLFFDPFRGPYALPSAEIVALRQAAPHEMSTPASARDIMARVLRNAISSHYHNGQREQTHEKIALLKALDEAEPES